MSTSTDFFDDMHSSQVGDRKQDCESSQYPSKLGINVGENKCITEDGDGMRYSACSTNIFSEMPTLESTVTMKDEIFFEDILQERPDREFPTSLSNVDVPLQWRGSNLKRARDNVVQRQTSATAPLRFNVRQLQMLEKEQEESSEQPGAASKEEDESEFEEREDESEFEERQCAFFFRREPCMPSDADVGFVDDYDERNFWRDAVALLDAHEVPTSSGEALKYTMFSGVSQIEAEVLSGDADLRAAPLKHSSTLTSFERSATMHSMPNNMGSNIMVGSPARALCRKRAAASRTKF